jgi:arylsulfatase A-like enzyme
VKGSRFMGVLFLTDPHAPYAAPAASREFSAHLSDYIAAPKRESESPLPPEVVAGIVDAYDDEVRYADAQIGRLIDWLKENDLFEQTAIVVTADHGEIFGAHQCYQHAYHMWEPVLRVPFIVHSRDMMQQGVFQRMASHTDLMPTLLDLAGIPVRSAYGASIFENRGNQKDGEEPPGDASEKRVPIYSAYDARGVRRQAARLGMLKLIRYEKMNQQSYATGEGFSLTTEENPSLRIPGPRYELFDLENDPLEQVNLFATTERKAELEILKNAVRYRKPPEKKVQRKKKNEKKYRLDQDTLDALRAAGYIE